MHRQNRVNPFGNLISTPARGTLMGNRGCLHDTLGHVTNEWARKSWVSCLLEFKGRHRKLMAPGQYTELFFLDEATALAAGHRPCGTCQKSRYENFKQAWLKANNDFLPGIGASIKEIDERMQGERRVSAGESAAWTADIGDLPDGTMLEMNRDEVWLKWRGRLYHWMPDGYDVSRAAPDKKSVVVITPRSVVRTLMEGYCPTFHKTVESARPVAPQTAPSSSMTDKATPPKQVRSSGGGSPRLPDEGDAARSGQLYKLQKTPAGKQLFTYFAAILRVTGMYKGEIFPLKKFLGNFSTHEQAGRIEKVGAGYRLTAVGIDYFADRYRRGSRQHVDKGEVQLMAKQIRTGGEEWEPVC